MSSPPSILAFGIAYLPMLGWLTAAAVPLLIHLLSRRRYREMSWAAMEYLLAAVRRRSRQIQIEQWLLLAVRMLVIALVVLALAQPYVERFGVSAASSGATHRVLVFDTSYSMAYRPTDKSRFEHAKEMARRILDESRQGDALTLVAMGAPPRVVVGTPAFDPAALGEEIDSLQATHTGADLAATIPLVAGLLENVRRESPRLRHHEVYFLTDMQRQTWAPNLGTNAQAELRRQCEELTRSAELIVIDVGQPTFDNLAVTSLAAKESVATVGRRIALEARVKDFGGRQRSRQSVELLVDGRRADQQYVDVPAGGEATMALACRFDSPGDHTVEVRAEGDALEVDNRRLLVIPVRQAVRVLCIDGRPATDPREGAAGYLATALAPETDRGGRPLVDVEIAPESALTERDLAAYDSIFLSDVAQFTAGEAQVLAAYVRRGGSLVFFLGPQVSIDSYNKELGDGPGGRAILPGRLEAVAAPSRPGIDPLGYRHPIVREFRGHEKSGLLSTIVSQYVRLRAHGDAGARVALALANGDPLIVETAARRGRVTLVTTSADTAWTPMPLWISYPQLVREILAFSISGQTERRNVETGQPLEDSMALAPSGTTVTIDRTDGQSRSVPVRVDGDTSVWSFDETYLSGLYTARIGPPIGRTRLLAVNVNTAESDLAQVDSEEFSSGLWSGIALDRRVTWHGPDDQRARPVLERGSLHVEILYGLLALLLAETIIAWRFGYHRL